MERPTVLYFLQSFGHTNRGRHVIEQGANRYFFRPVLSVGNHVSLGIQIFIRLIEKTCLGRVVSGSAEMKRTIVTFVLMILMISKERENKQRLQI